jgi:hypothetical protein
MKMYMIYEKDNMMNPMARIKAKTPKLAIKRFKSMCWFMDEELVAYELNERFF